MKYESKFDSITLLSSSIGKIRSQVFNDFHENTTVEAISYLSFRPLSVFLQGINQQRKSNIMKQKK